MPGTITYADWSVSWSIPNLSGGGLRLSNVRYKGRLVLYRAEQPFALVDYHGGVHTYKEGLNPGCNGRPYRALKPTAPNTSESKLPAGSYATNDNRYNPTTNPNGAVFVEEIPASPVSPARLMIWSKFQIANYQYIHRWELEADGRIHGKIGLGGELLPGSRSISHIHNFYYRLDFDILGNSNNLVQRFDHKSNATGDDIWTDILLERKETVDPQTFTKWRILQKTPKANGRNASYELIPGSGGLPDGTYSTGDLWVTRYVSSQTGYDVGCTDEVLNSQYVNGQSVDGADIVVWYCLREHHFPYPEGEERIVLPYHFLCFELKPADFLDDTPQDLYETNPPSP